MIHMSDGVSLGSLMSFSNMLENAVAEVKKLDFVADCWWQFETGDFLGTHRVTDYNLVFTVELRDSGDTMKYWLGLNLTENALAFVWDEKDGNTYYRCFSGYGRCSTLEFQGAFVAKLLQLVKDTAGDKSV